MPANNRAQNQPAATPASPTAKSMQQRYTNKDGSKIITVPKGPPSPTSDAPPTTPTTATMPPTPTTSGGQHQPPAVHPVLTGPAPPLVNRKKQKRRAKQLAKQAAAGNGAIPSLPSTPSLTPAAPSRLSSRQHDDGYDDDDVPPPPTGRGNLDEVDYGDEDDDEYFNSPPPMHNHHGHDYDQEDYSGTGASKKKSKKKMKAPALNGESSFSEATPSLDSMALPRPPPPPLQHHHVHQHDMQGAGGSGGISKEKIWNTSSHEERERIKEFWLGLGEDERKSLVKVEKDAVLKKMKEQQKQTCSCTVCGRKRTAIEEELEGLYDAYYEELEQFANHPHSHHHHAHDGPPLLSDGRRFGGSVGGGSSSSGGLRPPQREMPGAYPSQVPHGHHHHHHHSHPEHQPSRARIVEHGGGADDEDPDREVFTDEEPAERHSFSSEDPDMGGDYPTDFFNFGNSLTVQGGILTVADDLLKNDGKKFIEMMEQLAERRMAREEENEGHYDKYGHPINGGMLSGGHSHSPEGEGSEDAGYVEGSEDEDFDSQDDEYEEDEVWTPRPPDAGDVTDRAQDTMTDAQRMEEGRRMFQIFAARMFEQRVLTAYREKVAKERQDKLIEELEEESRADSQRNAKKAAAAQRRKDRILQRKQAQAEAQAKKEASKAAEEEARNAEESKRQEEQRLKAEEKRRKKEAMRRAEEEERLRKEAERLRLVNERKEKQAEQERKVREAKEREKRLKEEQRFRENEVREKKEREAREKRQKEEAERAEKAKAERETQRDKQRQERKGTQKPPAAMPSLAGGAAIPTHPAKQHRQRHPAVSVPALPQVPVPATAASPQVSVATPALPKAPTPIRPRTMVPHPSDMSAVPPSHASQSGSGPSQNPSPHPLTPVHSSPIPVAVAGTTGKIPGSGSQPSQSTSPINAGVKMMQSHSSGGGIFGMPPLGMPPPPGLQPFQSRIPSDPFPPMGPGFVRPPPGMGAPPPGLGLTTRSLPVGHPPPGFPLGGGMEPMPFAPEKSSHSRQGSSGFEPGSLPGTKQPIGHGVIGRPGSVVPGQRLSGLDMVGPNMVDLDDLNGHLGSSALLDDSDDPLDLAGLRRAGAGALSGPRSTLPPPPPPFMGDAMFQSPMNPWLPSATPAAHNPFGPPPGFGATPWGGPPPFMAPNPTHHHVRPNQGRSVTVRLMLCTVCKDLNNLPSSSSLNGSAAGFIDLATIKAQIDILAQMQLPADNPVTESEILDICETEGNQLNGGGSFDVRRTTKASGGDARVEIRWEPASSIFEAQAVGAAAASSSSGPVIGTPVSRASVPGEIGSPRVGTFSPVMHPSGLGGMALPSMTAPPAAAAFGRG